VRTCANGEAYHIVERLDWLRSCSSARSIEPAWHPHLFGVMVVQQLARASLKLKAKETVWRVATPVDPASLWSA